MAIKGASRNGDAFNEGTISNHIEIKKWNSGTENSSGYYSYDNSDAKVNGTIKRASGTVYINNKLACSKSDSTTETDTYTLPSGWSYDGGQHTNASGTISGGSSTVFINNSPLARVDDSITTHANTNTTIKDGSTNVYVG